MSFFRSRRLGAPLALAVGLALALGTQAAGATTAHQGRTTTSSATYYLALGDSLAQGVQPCTNPSTQGGCTLGADIETNQGYVDDLYAQLAPLNPSLQLVKLGCPGETTTSMINGGVCPASDYPVTGTQLGDAAAFLSANAGAVQLVTIDIGANDVDNCIVGGVINPTCVQQGLATVATNLPRILSTLQAADPGVQIVAMNYYDPFVVAYLQHGGKATAGQSVHLTKVFNGELGKIYRAFHVKVAQVGKAFQISDWKLGNGVAPDNVVSACDLTYMCFPAPIGPNIHCNPDGYSVIAGAFDPEVIGLGPHHGVR